MEKGNMRRFSKENRGGTFGADSHTDSDVRSRGSLDRATVVTTVRRMGFIMVKMHEVIMSSLCRDGKTRLAEQFNDVFKPLADMLLHFELCDTPQRETDDGERDGV